MSKKINTSTEKPSPLTPKVGAAEKYKQLESLRDPVRQRAIDCARVTIPSLVPPVGHSEGQTFRTPYQATGARCINNLSSKILLALFPPNTAFFKLGLDDFTAAKLKASGADVDGYTENLALVERAIVSFTEEMALRPILSQVIKQLEVAGNGVLSIDKTGQCRYFGIHQFVCKRDPEGNVLDLVIEECVAPETLSPEVRTACEVDKEGKVEHKTVNVYTWMRREGDQYRVSQEINSHLVPNSEGTYPLDAPGFIVLRWSALSGEDYGRGMVEEYLGDFNALDNLSRDILKASAAAAKVIFTVKPNSTIKAKQLSTAESGDVLQGSRDDVGTIGLDKFADFRITLERIETIKAQLSEAFLMHSSVQRQAERVTAEEIRYMAQELEDALGGVYSILAQELQAPMVRRIINVMTKLGKLPALPKKQIRMTITTGLEALGRGHDLNKLLTFVKTLVEIYGPQVAMQRLNEDAFIRRIATAMSVDTKDLILTEQEAQQKMQQQMAATMAQNSAPGVATAIARNTTQPQG